MHIYPTVCAGGVHWCHYGFNYYLHICKHLHVTFILITKDLTISEKYLCRLCIYVIYFHGYIILTKTKDPPPSHTHTHIHGGGGVKSNAKFIFFLESCNVLGLGRIKF